MSTTDPTAPVATAVTVPVTSPVVKKIAKKVAKPVAQKAPATATKLVAKVAPQATLKPEPTVAAVPTVQPKSDKLLKAKKPKLVRDSLTIPKLEYLMLEALKLRAGKLGSSVKKSELFRAGIKALAAMSDTRFLAALKAVPAIKTGRPSKD